MSAEYGKGICPECQRTIGGRYIGVILSNWRPRKVELSRHKALDGRPCNGGHRVVVALEPEPELTITVTDGPGNMPVGRMLDEQAEAERVYSDKEILDAYAQQNAQVIAENTRLRDEVFSARADERKRLAPAVNALAEFANDARAQRDQEFCVYPSEFDASQAEFDALLAPFGDMIKKADNDS